MSISLGLTGLKWIVIFTLKHFNIIFIGYFPFTVIAKYWRSSLCCMVHSWAHLIPSSLYLPLPCPYVAPSPPLPALVTTDSLSLSESASFLLNSLVCCIFEIPHISGIIQYLSLCDWLILLQENGEQEDNHVPGLRWVPETGHQVSVLGREEFKSKP